MVQHSGEGLSVSEKELVEKYVHEVGLIPRRSASRCSYAIAPPLFLTCCFSCCRFESAGFFTNSQMQQNVEGLTKMITKRVEDSRLFVSKNEWNQIHEYIKTAGYALKK